MADSPAPHSSEAKLWEGTSSQWLHFWYFVLCGLLAVLFIWLGIKFSVWWLLGILGAAVMAGVRWLLTRTTVYSLTNERLLIARGILDRHQDNLELYRVRDYALTQPLFLRMLGLGNLLLITSDTMTPNVTLQAIKDAEGVREKLRHAVEAARDRKRVRSMDVDNVDGAIDGGADAHHHE